MEQLEVKKMIRKELLRKCVHLLELPVLLGYTVIASLYGPKIGILTLTVLLIILLEIEYIRLEYKLKLPLVVDILRRHEKDNIAGNIFFIASTIICFAAFDYPIAGEHDLVMARGRDFLLAYHAIGKTEVGGYVFHKEIPYVNLNPKERHMAITKDYGKYDQKFLRILQTLTDSDPVFHGSFTQIVMPEWHKGRVCLVGDAAYCPTPASGTGASLAMAGAYVLAKKLSETDDYKKAFAEYDTHVRPYAVKAQKSALGPANLITGKVPLPYGLTNAFLRLLPVSLLTFLLTKVHSHKLEMPLP
jgi:hypothetical protein